MSLFYILQELLQQKLALIGRSFLKIAMDSVQGRCTDFVETSILSCSGVLSSRSCLYLLCQSGCSFCDSLTSR